MRKSLVLGIVVGAIVGFASMYGAICVARSYRALSVSESTLRARLNANAADASKLLEQDRDGVIVLTDGARHRINQIKDRASK